MAVYGRLITLKNHTRKTHLMGPSLAYSSWICLSDIISLLVLRFLLSEHVSLKLNATQSIGNTVKQIYWEKKNNQARTPPQEKYHHHSKSQIKIIIKKRTHLQPRKRQCSHSQVSTSMMRAMGKLKMNHVPKLITFASGYRLGQHTRFQNPSNLFSYVRIMTFSGKKSTLSPTARVLTGGGKKALYQFFLATLFLVFVSTDSCGLSHLQIGSSRWRSP